MRSVNSHNGKLLIKKPLSKPIRVSNQIIFAIAVLMIYTQTSSAYYDYSQREMVKGPPPVQSESGVLPPKGEVSHKPADFWYIWWTGIGKFGTWLVSNTVQGGVFGQPPCGDYFDGSVSQWVCAYQGYNDAYRGLTGEYPKGARQFYVWGAGPWIGAERRVKWPADTTKTKIVATGGYYSDLGAIQVPELDNSHYMGELAGLGLGNRGMAFSTQVIPSIGHEYDGQFVFSQGGLDAKQDYQGIWPFADTSINKKREDPATHVLPDKGSIISQEDTYVVAGDWLPEKDATCIWVRKYDTEGLGIRVEQRTYSWNYDYNDAYIFTNWKIRNMTQDTLFNLYTGYFMDADIGQGMGTDQGSDDDLIGYDRSYVPELGRHLDLGYTYDSDGYEPGWRTPAGYVGIVMMETSADEDTGAAPRMKGFQYWQRVGDVGQLIDEDMQDSVKYMVLSLQYPERDSFMIASTPSDMRQLSCSGPRKYLLPGEEVDFTIAAVAAYTLDELKGRAISAIKQFNLGYLGYTPPPSPALSVIPGDSMVYLSWPSDPMIENYCCKMAAEFTDRTFEGYKVYRSLTGLPDAEEWNLLAAYGVGSKTKDTVLVGYTVGTSDVDISFEGFSTVGSALFKTNKYTITFATSGIFIIKDSVENLVYNYNRYAMNGSGGYCILDNLDATPYAQNPGYLSGALIWIDGFYIKIQNKPMDPNNPGVVCHPLAGDEFTVRAFKSEPVGTDTTFEHFYIDRNVVNGKKYYYSVTSFSKRIPEANIPALESSLSGKRYWAIPMKMPPDYTGASASYKRITGVGDIHIALKVVNPGLVTGDKYIISFGGLDTLDPLKVDYWTMVNSNTNDSLLLACPSLSGEPIPLLDGLDVKLTAVTKAKVDRETVIDDKKTGWVKEMGGSNFDFARGDAIFKDGRDPYYSYEIIIRDSATGSVGVRGNRAPFTIRNMDLDAAGYFLYLGKSPDSLTHGDIIQFYKSSGDTQVVGDWYLRLRVFNPNVEDTTIKYIPPQVGDTFRLKILNRVTTEGKYEISTVRFDEKKSVYSLDNIRVVPNPYVIRASWDQSRYQRKIWFQGLPSVCTIRIFNIAGLLVKTIKHDERSVRDMRERSEMAGVGAHAWDFLSDEGLAVANGLYLFHVSTPDGNEKVGKFAIVK